MFKRQMFDMRTRRHLRLLRNGPGIKQQRYRRIVRQEELQWYITIAVALMVPVGIALGVFMSESSFKALFNIG
ncbi:hypothetical protein [Carnimonas bestiolae]|uniref:hypothetical protein n=1 Tax=Carnimonas bestiolae TaxID=3402172 RepID=UPI003EDB725B